jgi:AcrR family transcriptional regulator
MSARDAAADVATTETRRDLAVARALDNARSRAEHRVQLFLDAARELMHTNGGEFTVQEVVERSGQSLRTFYQYFAGKHELLLVLFEESVRAAARQLDEVIVDVEAPVDRLHRFLVEYYTMCRLTSEQQASSGPVPAMVEFAQQLLTSHPKEAARAFEPLVVRLVELLDEAAAAGQLRVGLDHRRIAGVVLQATMFNAFATTISGSPARRDGDGDGDAEPELLWDLLVRGIASAEPGPTSDDT